jgi:hypothetical protein
LVAIRGRERLVLSVSLLQRSIAVQIEADWVRPLRADNTPVTEIVSSGSSSLHPRPPAALRRSSTKEGLPV